MKTKHIVISLIVFIVFFILTVYYYLTHEYQIEYRDINNIVKNNGTTELNEKLLPVGYLDYDSNIQYWGYIDQNGQVAISLTYSQTYPFDENDLAIVQEIAKDEPYDEIYGLITTQEQKILPIQYDLIQYVGQDIYYYELGDTGHLGKYNATTKEMTVLKDELFDRMGTFNEGLAYVVKDDKVGYIDETGSLVIGYYFDDKEDVDFNFMDGYAFFYKNGKYGIINTSGNYVLQPTLDDVINTYEFSSDYANFLLDDYDEVPFRQDKLWGYITRDGNVLYEPQYKEAYPFTKDGIARVKLEKGYNFIDQDGHILNENRYDEANDFYHGYAMVNKDGKEGLINENGIVIIEPQYDFVGTVNQNHILTIETGHSTYRPIDELDKGFLINYRFGDDMTDCQVMFASDDVGDNISYVIMDFTGKRVYNEITPRDYKEITLFGEQYIYMTAYEEKYNFEYYTFVDSHGNLLWKLYK